MRFLYFLLITLLFSCKSTADSKSINSESTEQAAEIELLNPSGRKTKLSSLKGKLVLIDFGHPGVDPVEKKTQK